MKVLMAAPFESNGRYKGGIGSVVNNLILQQDILSKYELEIIKFNTCTVTRKAGSDSRFNFQNIRNSLNLYFTISKYVQDSNAEILYYHTSIRFALFKDLLILMHAKLTTSVKTVIHIHFADYSKIMTGCKIIDYIILKILTKYVDEIVFLSKTTMNSFVERGINISKCSVIYNFNTLSIEENIETYEFKKSRILNLLFVGTIGNRKGFFDLAKALENLEHYQFILHVCGEPENEVDEYEFNKIKEKFGNKMFFHGYISGDEKIQVYKKADVLVLPSYAEGLPMVILEAFGAGCAVIATSVGAIPEIVTKNNGIVIEPGDIDALTNAINFYLTHHEQLENTQKLNYLYSKDFDMQIFIKEISNVCRKLV